MRTGPARICSVPQAFEISFTAESCRSLRSRTTVFFPIQRVTHLTETQDEPPTIEIRFMENGGSFTGQLSGGTLTGEYIDFLGRERSMSVTRTSVSIDELLMDAPE